MTAPESMATHVGMSRTKRSLSVRLIAIFIASLVFSLAVIGAMNYALNRREAVDMNARRALDIARGIAAGVDAEAFAQVVQSGEKDEYWHSLKAYLDTVITRTGLIYLYVLHDMDDEKITTFAEGRRDGATAEVPDFGDTDVVGNYDKRLADVFAGEDVMSDAIYDSDEWGSLVSGMAPIRDAEGNVLGVVGADVGVDDVLNEVYRLGVLNLLLILVISAVTGLTVAFYLKRSLGSPIAELTDVAQRIARGEPDVRIGIDSSTEIGALADSFREMAATIDRQALALKAISEGDLSISVTPRGENDVMSYALINTINRLGAMIKQINALSTQVAAESVQMAASARSLATGATSQASAVEQLSASVTEIAIQTKQNADLAEKSAALANGIRDAATDSFGQVENLIDAVNEINNASNAIRSVVKAIEDIAFQTNLLAFNASVEAARAGDMGRGFGVVSREVQNLSKKTTDSAKETAELIADAIAKAKQGVDLALGVHQSMSKVIGDVVESDRIANEIAQSSKEQMIAIDQVNKTITLVTGVVQKNSNVAEESASASQNMSVQAASLSDLVSQFRT